MSCKVYWITLGVLIKGRSLGGVTEPACFIRRARRRFLYGAREQLADTGVKWWRKGNYWEGEGKKTNVTRFSRGKKRGKRGDNASDGKEGEDEVQNK